MLIIRQTSEVTLRLRTAAISASKKNFSKDYASSSDDEKEPKKSKKPKKVDEKVEETATARLNRLLATMQTDDNYTLAKQASSMARPGESNKKRKDAVKNEADSKDIFAAAKRVAAMLGGDEQKKQTESELLSKLLGQNQQQANQAQGVAKTSTKLQESELSLSDLIVGMKIDRRQQPKEQTRGEFVRRTLSAKSQHQQEHSLTGSASRTAPRNDHKREAESYTGSVNLFGSEPLGIFKQLEQLHDSPDMLSTWAHLNRNELKLQVAHPPANYFEKMALWTEQGKLWRYPIDNEQDSREEIDVDFSEHIFLEQHLEPWCPAKGPIRHFMELVCVGLSKNPYITAQEKKDHILWYRNYFNEKIDILRDLMSKDKMDTANAGDPAKIEA